MKSCIPALRQFTVVGLLVLASPRIAEAQAAPLWDSLSPGPHAVGFRSFWEFDHSRRYNITFDDKTRYAPGKAARPILINVWYPATKADNAVRIPYRDYLKIRSDDPRLAKFSQKLAEYNRGVIAVEVLGKAAKELSEREKSLLEGFLDTPTACVRDAAPAMGTFPLVIYHSGAGSSFEDNSVFCEFLASHGFLVIGSAFQRGDGTSLGTGPVEGSARDLEFLIAQGRKLPGVDWEHIGLVGHSLGAQSALYYRSQANSPVDAVVSLDTTQDYRGLSDTSWEYFTTPVLKNAENFTCPLLMAADSHAFFELADALHASRRYYLTLKGMGHNDYISQGTIGRELRLKVGDAKKTAEALAKQRDELATARTGYRAVCEYALRFLEAELKGDAAGKEVVANKFRKTKLGGEEPHVEFVPERRSGPDPYQDDGVGPPTPRQVYRLIREAGSARTIAILNAFRKGAAKAPIYEAIFELNLVSDLLDRNKSEDARALSEYYRECGNDCGKKFMSFAKSFEEIGRADWAIRFYRRAAQLDPTNKEAAVKLKELERKKKEGSK